MGKFFEKLAFLLERNSRSQKQIADAIGVSPSTISQMALGNRRPYLDQAFALSKALDISIEYLADDSLEIDDRTASALSEQELSLIHAIRRYKLNPDLIQNHLMSVYSGKVSALVVTFSNIKLLTPLENSDGGLITFGNGSKIRISPQAFRFFSNRLPFGKDTSIDDLDRYAEFAIANFLPDADAMQKALWDESWKQGDLPSLVNFD